jgi:CYTH domain
LEEGSDFIEIEAKVVPRPPYSRLVELAQAAAPPSFRMVRKPHVAFFDLYLDTSGLTLARNQAYLRVRFDIRALRGKGKGRYKLFFKDNGPPNAGERYLSRREVRTNMDRDELLAYSTGRMVGKAAQLAYEVLERAGERDEPLEAICLISTFRRYYTMHSDAPEMSDCLNMSIEHSTAFRASAFNVEQLVTTCFLDVPLASPVYDFDLCEAELTVENDDAANAMFQRLASALDREYGLITGSKYLTCLEKLGIHPNGSARS